jgi:hypothetical protein
VDVAGNARGGHEDAGGAQLSSQPPIECGPPAIARRRREHEANGASVGQLEPAAADAPLGNVHCNGELQRGVEDERAAHAASTRCRGAGRTARAGARHSMLKWASVVRPVVPLIGSTSCGHAENATTRSISARNNA